MLPKGWKQVPLHTVAEVRTGLSKNARREGATLKRPYLRVANVQDGTLDLSDVQEIDVPASQTSRYTLQAGDLLLIEGNGNPENLGRGCLWRGQIPEAVHQNHVFAVRTHGDGRLLPEFLELLVQSRYGRDYFLSCAKGSTGLSSLNSTQLKGFPVILPPFEGQLRIARVIDTWGAAIASTEKLLANSRSQLSELRRTLLFGRIRCVAERGPWARFQIGDLLRVIKRPVEWNDDEKYPLISVRRRSGGAFHRETLYGRDILTKKLNRVEVDDFLISKMQAVHGAMAMVPNELAHMYVSDSYLTMRAIDPVMIDVSFFGWLSTTPEMRRAAYRSSYGVHIEKMTFDLDMFLKEKVTIPLSIKEQRQIVGILNAANQEVHMIQASLEFLKEERRALVNRLLTGKRCIQLADSIAEPEAA